MFPTEPALESLWKLNLQEKGDSVGMFIRTPRVEAVERRNLGMFATLKGVGKAWVRLVAH